MDSLIADLKTNIMTKQKEIGYEVGNVAWHNLDGYKELWNKADFDTKEHIVNEQGRLAIKLAIPLVSNRFNYKSFIIGCMVGATICIGILHVLL